MEGNHNQGSDSSVPIMVHHGLAGKQGGGTATARPAHDKAPDFRPGLSQGAEGTGLEPAIRKRTSDFESDC